MEVTRELMEYLTRAAQGVEEKCPPDVDAEWHACLANAEAYQHFCLAVFGVAIEHVVAAPGPCHARLRR